MSTYLELTNKLLRRVNEVQLTSSNFVSAFGIQSMAKDSIQASINEIMTKDDRWPFNYRTISQLLVVGQENYAIPDNYEFMDWKSFRIRKDDALNINTIPLGLINRDYYHQRIQPSDEDRGSLGRGIPRWIMPDSAETPNANADYRGYTVTPSPDKAYTLDFQAYEISNVLDLYSDECRIPTRYDYVILSGALKHFYLFRDNIELSQAQEQAFGGFIAEMRNVLVPKKDSMVDTRVNSGGNVWRTQAYQPGGRY